MYLYGWGWGVANNVKVSDSSVTKLKFKDELFGIIWTFM